MAEVNAKISLKNNNARDRVEVDRFSEDGHTYLEVFDGQTGKSTCVILNDVEIGLVIEALSCAVCA